MKISTITSILALNLFVMGTTAMAMVEEETTDASKAPTPKYVFKQQEVTLQAIFDNTVTQKDKSIEVATKEGTCEYHLVGHVSVKQAPCVKVSYEVDLQENSGFAVGVLTGDQSTWMRNVGFSTPGVHKGTIEIEDPNQDNVWLVFTNNLATAGISKFKILNYAVEVGTDPEDLLTASIIAAQNPDDYKIMVKASKKNAKPEDIQRGQQLREKLISQALEKDKVKQEQAKQVATTAQKKAGKGFFGWLFGTK